MVFRNSGVVHSDGLNNVVLAISHVVDCKVCVQLTTVVKASGVRHEENINVESAVKLQSHIVNGGLVGKFRAASNGTIV